MRFVVVLSVVTACYSAPSDHCGITCVDSCPGDLVCTAGVCMEADGTCTQPAQNLSAVQLGARHACVLTADSAIECWGDNASGQLGNNTTVASSTAVRAGDSGIVWTALAVGGEHTCGIHDGVVACWGENGMGQAAASPGTAILKPTAVAFGNGVPELDQIAAGSTETCAIGAGQLWCWGANLPPTQIGAMTTWQAVSVGFDHACGLDAGGQAWCWGDNAHHQISGDATATYATPLMIGPASQIVAGEGSTCAITGGQLSCWGRNDTMLFDGSGTDVTAPAMLGSRTDWTSIALGHQAACGIAGGDARCWGTTAVGALGDGVWQHVVAVDAVADLGAATAVRLAIPPATMSREAEFGCVLATGNVACFGDDPDGELGNGAHTQEPAPIAIAAPAGSTWSHVRSGHHHACGQTADGMTYCWGADDSGQVTGVSADPCVAGAPCSQPMPVAIPSTIAPTDLVAGGDYSCARQSGTISCWGLPQELGIGTTTTTAPSAPQPPRGAWASLYGGDTVNCGYDGSELACWGDFLGPTPIKETIASSDTINSVAGGDGFVCVAIGATQARACWGANNLHQLGDGTTTNSSGPTVLFAGTVAKLAAAKDHICSLLPNGAITCWGSNNFGESNHSTLGVASDAGSSVGNIDTCTDVAVGGDYSCAICNPHSGAMPRPFCWGSNVRLQLGRGASAVSLALDYRPAAVAVPTDRPWLELATGDDRACALDTTGNLYCWGNGVRGEFGNGSQGACVPTPIKLAP